MNPVKLLATEFYKNGRIQKEKIKHHPKFLYGYLREDVQDMILEKLQKLIDQELLKEHMKMGRNIRLFPPY